MFKYYCRFRGNFYSVYEFKTKEELDRFVQVIAPEILAEHEGTSMITGELQPLDIGSTCHVLGEGTDEFVITGVVNYSPDRWGFILDSGWSEEIYKCYPVKQNV